jgi:hypothetical protein
MTEGIVWHLVVSEVSFSKALHGSTTATTIYGRTGMEISLIFSNIYTYVQQVEVSSMKSVVAY